MRARGLAGVVAGGAGAVAAALTAGVLVERRVVRSRRAGSAGADELGGLRGDVVAVTTPDGVHLHVEVDEPDDCADAETTLVFVHGYALSLDCWHFQRRHFRGRQRLVLFDQRSHGRSGRSDDEHATIDQLGDDLRQVVDEVAPDGRVVLVGHSMGGMTVMAFAERHPDVFAQRVSGAALLATASGGLKTYQVLGRLIPDRIGGQLGPRVIAALARAPGLVDSVRRRGSDIGFLVADRFAFGQRVPASVVEFVDEMLAATPFEVLAQFFHNFDTLDKDTALDLFSHVPTTIVTGTADMLTSVAHSKEMAGRIAGSRLVECPEAGHLVILEQPDRVNGALEDLVVRASHTDPEGTRAP